MITRITTLGLFCLLLMPFSLQAQQDAIARYFQQYAEDETFSSVYISGAMLRLLGRSDTNPEEKELRESFNQLRGLRILAADSLPDGMRYYRDVVATLERESYEELMKIQEDGEKVLFLIKQKDEEVIEELLMLVGSEEQFFMLSFIGNIDLEAISRLAEGMDIEGMESLERIKEKTDQY